MSNRAIYTIRTLTIFVQGPVEPGEKGGGRESPLPHIFADLETKSVPSKDFEVVIAPPDLQTFRRLYVRLRLAMRKATIRAISQGSSLFLYCQPINFIPDFHEK